MRIVRLKGNCEIDIGWEKDPVAGQGEVVIETVISAICGSELKSYRGPGTASGNPGHEAAGTVAALGKGVSGFAIGQRVGVSAVSGCGTCEFCAEGRYTWCPDVKVYGNMHAERFLAAAGACHALPDDVPWDAGVLLSGDGLGVPYHTSTKITSSGTGTVAVFGVGPVGLGSVLLQAYLGRRVIAVDVVPFRLETAKRLGASETVDVNNGDPVQQIHELTGGAGADVCIEAAGKPETALACFSAVRTGGTVVFNGEQPAVPLSPSEHFIRRDITAIGSWFYHFNEFERMLELYRGGLRVTELISDSFPLTEAAAAYEKFSTGRSAKVLLEYGIQ